MKANEEAASYNRRAEERQSQSLDVLAIFSNYRILYSDEVPKLITTRTTIRILRNFVAKSIIIIVIFLPVLLKFIPIPMVVLL